MDGFELVVERNGIVIVDERETLTDRQFLKELQQFFVPLDRHQHPHIQNLICFCIVTHAIQYPRKKPRIKFASNNAEARIVSWMDEKSVYSLFNGSANR
ncbi:MAG: hypothetical protein BWX84_02272 [Verrucomicrobia bacterium ADurb.Bin118]|nr:MAG: hypothetical protein BWX84_02272 [Verrucomicrobia bacterium ADurb.Bin118]